MFLHGSWLHLLGNMLFLFVFGNNVEDRFGRIRYLLFYLACGYAAAYGFALTQPNSQETLVGASGAIAGVLGAYLMLFPRARVISLIPFLFFLPASSPRGSCSAPGSCSSTSISWAPAWPKDPTWPISPTWWGSLPAWCSPSSSAA